MRCIYNYYGRAEHMVEFAQGILSDPSAYSNNGQAIRAGLIKEEIKKHKENMSNSSISQAGSQINQQIKLIQREPVALGWTIRIVLNL